MMPIDTLRSLYRRLFHGTWLQRWSLRAALREQGLEPMLRYLEGVVPDITDQYTTFRVDTDYLRLKVRALHAFQMSLVRAALNIRGSRQKPTSYVVDVGDSAGTHVQYVRQYIADKYDTPPPTCWSVNWDPEAVKRIQSKGLDARLQNVEQLDPGMVDHHVWAARAMCFETLEHLENPVGFLRAIRSCGCLVMTVPWVRSSRVVAGSRTEGQEGGHCFELSPEDWRAVLDRAGWRVCVAQVYRQYPRWHPARVMRGWWRRRDYEGFWGCVATPREGVEG